MSGIRNNDFDWYYLIRNKSDCFNNRILFRGCFLWISWLNYCYEWGYNYFWYNVRWIVMLRYVDLIRDLWIFVCYSYEICWDWFNIS